MAKKPATILGMILSFTLVAILAPTFAYLLVGPIVSIKDFAIITAAVLAPGIALAIFRQIRLRRAVSREARGSGTALT